jgi:CRP-like cAMP-binding protein
VRSTPSASDPTQNDLLAALPAAEYERLQLHFDRVDMPQGLTLFDSGDTVTDVYFPLDSIVSLLSVAQSGAAAEIGIVGNEGIVGVSLFMGGASTPSRAVVQIAGTGIRLNARALNEAFDTSAPVMHLLLRYTQALITQMSQTAACNRHHSLDQQLCRWLLMTLDRVAGSQIHMTQELMANMLGVRREGVTVAALKLQRAGLLRYSRGHISILDRPGLEQRACECYGVVKREYDRLLPRKTAT